VLLYFTLLYNVVWAEAYLRTKWHLDPCSRSAAIDMGRKLGALPPFWGGAWVPIEHNVPWAEAYLHTKWHLDASSRLAILEMGRKLGRGLCPLLRKGAGPDLAQSRLG